MPYHSLYCHRNCMDVPRTYWNYLFQKQNIQDWHRTLRTDTVHCMTAVGHTALANDTQVLQQGTIKLQKNTIKLSKYFYLYFNIIILSTRVNWRSVNLTTLSWAQYRRTSTHAHFPWVTKNCSTWVRDGTQSCLWTIMMECVPQPNSCQCDSKSNGVNYNGLQTERVRTYIQLSSAI